MKYTRQQIEELPAGAELDEAIAELLGVAPQLTWQVLSPDESGSAASFDSKREADEWLARHKSEIPNSVLKDYHVGVWKRYPFYSRSIQDAWGIAEFFASNKGSCKAWYEMSYRPTGAQAGFTGNRHQFGYASFEECDNDRAKCQALAMCRAALLPYIGLPAA
jgi:hypothetical protein